MGYSRAHVKEALNAARRDGKSIEALMVGDRETEITLERMGYLPVDQDAVDKRIQDWYVSQGLVMREATSPDTPGDTPEDAPGGGPDVDVVGITDIRGMSSGAAIEAVEAALAAASAALRLAKVMTS
ncbi:MAG: hypothetical protein ABFD94_14055 [Armatimonadia bacterium]|jgi:hypothetical protein